MMKKLRKMFWLLCCFTFFGHMIAVAQNYEWALAMEGTEGSSGGIRSYNAVVDSVGNVYIAGLFMATVDFDPGQGVANLTAVTSQSQSTNDAFLAKYDSEGNYLWAISMGGNRGDDVKDLVIGKDGDVYITGSFTSDMIDMDPSSATANLVNAGFTNGYTHYDLFVAKYDPDGNYLWAQRLGSLDGTEVPYGITVDAEDNIYLTGFTGAAVVDFDPASGTVDLGGYGAFDTGFFAKYDKNGNYKWARMIDNAPFATGDPRYAGPAWGMDVAVDDQSGSVYYIGKFTGFARFNPGPDEVILGAGTGSGGDAAHSWFVCKYDTGGNFIWAKALTGPISNLNGGNVGAFEPAAGSGLAVDDGGNLYVTGMFRGTMDFDFGPDSVGLASAHPKRFDMALAKYGDNGDLHWVQGIGEASPLPTVGSAVVVRGPRVYVSGYFGETVDFDPGPGVADLVSNGYGALVYGDVFLAQYDTAGSYLCALSVGGVGDDAGYGLAVDRQGAVYITGVFQGIVDFDPEADVVELNSGPLGLNSFILKLHCQDSVASSYFSATICEGDSYSFGDSSYTTAGMYEQVFFNASSSCGCDSVRVLQLTVESMPEPVITVNGFVLGVTNTYATYQWIKDGATIVGATAATLTASENGLYQVVVTNETGCTDTSEVYNVTNVGIGRAHYLAGKVRIYPNPTTDLVYIDVPPGVKVRVSLFGIEGREINSAGDVRELSLQQLPSGIYMIRIADADGRLIKIERLLKE